MSLKFVLGGSGTGKTTYVVSDILNSKNTGSQIYLVPEQFSLQSEKLLLSNRESISDVQVLSFNRLAYRLFSFLGGPPGKIVGEIGKQMLIRKILTQIQDELVFYKNAADKPGFVSELADTITNLNEYQVTAVDLRMRAGDENKTLGAKLLDTAIILESYRKEVKDRYLIGDEMPEILCDKLDLFRGRPIPILDGAAFWIDGFSGFMSWERQVIKHIISRAGSVTITLTINTNLTTEQMETVEKISSFTEEENIKKIYLADNRRHKKTCALHGLTAFFDGKPTPIENVSSIEIVEAAEPYTECLLAAKKVLDLVNRKNCLFSDIAVVCDNKSAYEKILTSVFDRLKIPLFVDNETCLTNHPLAELVLSALDIALYGRRYEDVFRFLKTNLTPLKSDSIDCLENYVLANGISSYKWQYSFKTPAAETARQRFLDCIKHLWNLKPTSKDLVKGFSIKIFDMLVQNGVPERLVSLSNLSYTCGKPDEARQISQVWSSLCDVFDKYVEILGDIKLDLKTFADCLKAGLKKAKLGRIPPTSNQVMLGDTSRSRYPNIKAMIVLGANDGSFPAPVTMTGIFTEHERNLLRNSQLPIAPDTLSKTHEQTYNIYCTLTKPTDKLFILFSKTNSEGSQKKAAPIVKHILKFFSNIKITSSEVYTEYDTKIPPEQIHILPAARDFLLRDHVFSSSVTRLETYALCPYLYYMRYILGARQRKHYEVLPSDLGKHFHESLAGFTELLRDGQIPTGADEVSKVVKNLVASAIKNTDLLEGTARNRHIAEMVFNTTLASCEAIVEHLKRGSFVPFMAEEEVRLQLPIDDKTDLGIYGRVDRVDILTNPDDAIYVKIIDYKSGDTGFSHAEVTSGVQLQLMLYLSAVVNKLTTSGKNAKPGGAFYFPINDPILDTNIELGEAQRFEGLLRSFRMSGVASEEVVTGIDNTLTPGTDSAVIPVTLKNDGAIRKTTAKTTLESGELENLLHVAAQTAINLSGRILTGNFGPNPYVTKKTNPCNYCPYGTACTSKKGGRS